MINETVFTNGLVVTRDTVVPGTVIVRGADIAAVERGRSHVSGAINLGGDYLIPGLVELHTDNLEPHFAPRPGVRWPGRSAMLAHDAQIAASAITTVLDAVALGDIYEGSPRVALKRDMVEIVRSSSAASVTRAEHFLHLRCELSYEGVVDAFAELAPGPLVRVVSLMDHTPGQRQFVDEVKYRQYYKGKYHMSDAEIDRFIARQRRAHERFSAPHREALTAICRERGLPLASHDDATPEHVAEAAEAGVVLAEFPTTEVAVHAARERGIRVMFGGPNMVTGTSHTGNISARAVAAKRLLDVVSSDYVPISLLHSACLMAGPEIGMTLPEAIACVSDTPARVVGFDDRGAIAPGKRADLAWVAHTEAGPLVKQVWRAGNRIVRRRRD
jgi:alpha-D-ribose 1-methylphosphonate 5-triphosphate diphosphatase